jgi:hypothetical protein
MLMTPIMVGPIDTQALAIRKIVEGFMALLEARPPAPETPRLDTQKIVDAINKAQPLRPQAG